LIYNFFYNFFFLIGLFSTFGLSSSLGFNFFNFFFGLSSTFGLSSSIFGLSSSFGFEFQSFHRIFLLVVLFDFFASFSDSYSLN
jgi:hypothetical protein